MTDALPGTPTPRILLWVPLPPPFSGPGVASELLAAAARPHLPDMQVENASLRPANFGTGRLDWPGLSAFARAYVRFVRRVRSSDVVCLVAAASNVGCLRDAVLVGTARLFGARVVFHMRGGRYGEFYAGSNAFMKRVLRFSWGSATRAIAQTPRLRHVLAEAAPHVEFDVLPNGLPAERFPAKATYHGDAPRILFVGNLVYHKGFCDLMEAFRTVRKTWPDARLACAGELPQPDRSLVAFLQKDRHTDYLRRRHELVAAIRAFVAPDNREGVEYAGIVEGDAKRALFLSADVLVLPSYTEGFSVAILEAMFHGLAIITTNVGGSPDVVRHGTNGLLIEPGDTTALAQAIDALIADGSAREAMGRRNAQEARERYALGAVAEQFAEILRKA